MASGRKRAGKRKGSRKGRKLSRKAKISRTPRRMGMSDVHHFRETINGGVIGFAGSTSSQVLSTGGLIMRLPDFPAYQTLGPAFEFARLNKCRINFIPKYNMQYNVAALGSSVPGSTSSSITGTMVTAVDQIPFYTASSANYVLATTWANDASNDTGITSASFVVPGNMTTSYVRGLQGSREKELYKKHSISFFPAFYDYIMSSTGTGAITSVTNPIGTFTNNGCVERKLKRWVSITNLTSQSSGSGATNVGPIYFGPVYALDVNYLPDSSAALSVALFDVRLTYSVSFKRLRGV